MARPHWLVTEESNNVSNVWLAGSASRSGRER